MRLTTKSRYGTRMILDIALFGNSGPVSLNDVSKRQNISLKYLEKLIPKLKEAGIVTTQRGPMGGHMLAKDPGAITVGEIVRVLEENTAITDCAERNDRLCGICNRAGDCLSRWVWIEASNAMFSRLDKISIAMLINQKETLLARAKDYMDIGPSESS
jgi:Rrf2 family transcriptional regulator, iron-sulfur cluster assembly transcription factor